MKKLIAAASALLFSYTASAQEVTQHEVKWNIANTIIFASFEFGYEYFIDGHQSVGADIMINDVYNFSINRSVKDFDTHSFQLSYNYYTSSLENASGLVISPLIKFRTGEYQKSEDTPVVDMSSFILGIGGGYKWNLNDKFVFGPFVNIGRNFSDEVNDEFNIAVEFNAGFIVGYRF
ncbi:MAG: DUF3575 domain-containing protein [Flavobacterium sp.]|nr:DUF3575 domain-containing protein [Flavobacterium sp.]